MPTHRASLYMCQLEDAIKDRLSEVGIMEDDTPRGKWLVRGEDDGLALEVAFVDHLEEHVGDVVT
jgi:hypothetical protein